MTKKHRIIGAVLSATLLIGAVALAQTRPEVTIGKSHPRLQDAQLSILKAWDKTIAAREAYRKTYPEEAHAFAVHLRKARTLLEEANEQLKLAAEEARHPVVPPPRPPRPPR